jgi:hypothetical protein
MVGEDCIPIMLMTESGRQIRIIILVLITKTYCIGHKSEQLTSKKVKSAEDREDLLSKVTAAPFCMAAISFN